MNETKIINKFIKKSIKFFGPLNKLLKIDIPIILIIIYSFGVIFQLWNLLNIGKSNFDITQFNFGNLSFFSFSNVFNDFSSILALTLMFGILIFLFQIFFVFFVKIILRYLFDFIILIFNFKFKSKSKSKSKYSDGYLNVFIVVVVFILIVSFFILNKNLIIFDFTITTLKNYIILLSPYFVTLFLIYFILEKKLTKLWLYVYFFLYLIYGFCLFQGNGYNYACFKVDTPNSIKDAINDCKKFYYKNDKYIFLEDGSVYDISSFKGFYTKNYLDNLNKKD